MLGSGAHIKIGDYEFQLDESEDHYAHDFSLPDYGPQAITGEENKASLNSRLLWSFTDFSGGEGNRLYYEDEPTKYWYSETLHGRQRGVLMGRPSYAVKTITTDYSPGRIKLVSGAGALWHLYNISDYGGADNVLGAKTIDGTNWSTPRVLTPDDFGYRITAATGDPENVYYAMDGYWAFDQKRSIFRIDRDGPPAVQMISEDNAGPPFVGLACLGGLVYAWTGSQLYSMNPVTPSLTLLSPDTFPNLSVWGQDVHWWGDCVAAENTVVCFTTANGLSNIYEFHEERGFAPLWSVPRGFTIHSITYHTGSVYLFGAWGGTASGYTTGYGGVYKIDLTSREASHVATIRKGLLSGLKFLASQASYGSEVTFASEDGRVFVLDTTTNAVSLLDDPSSDRWSSSNNLVSGVSVVGAGIGKITALATWGGKRFVGTKTDRKNLLPLGSEQSSEPSGVFVDEAFSDLGINNHTRSTAQAQHGTASQLLTKATSLGDMGIMPVIFSVLGTDPTPPAVPVIEGLNYTGSAYFRAVSTGRQVHVDLRWIDEDGNTISTTAGATTGDINAGWVRRTTTAAAPAGAVYVIPECRIDAVPVGEQHYVDAIMLEQSDTLSAFDSASGNIYILTYGDDELASRAASTANGNLAMSWYSPEHDFDLPYDGKLMHGVHLTWDVEDPATTSGLKAGQSIVAYGTFDGAAEVTLATITSASVPSTGIKGRTFVPYLPGGNTLKFFKMKYRVELKGTRTGGVDYQPPILWSSTIEASPANFTESWRLVVRIKDELSGTRPANRQVKAEDLRSYLMALKDTGTSVTFKDGARFKKRSDTEDVGYSTHTVVVAQATDLIQRNAEGVMQVTLKAVTT